MRGTRVIGLLAAVVWVVTVEMTYWMDMRRLEVPFSLKASVGL